jgi:glycosyltransferase involved in cell wall biosynthesis
MRVLIFEPDHKGHHFTYLRLLLPALRDLGVEIIVCTNPEAPASAEYAEQLAPLADCFTMDSSVPLLMGSPLKSALRRADDFVRLLRRYRPDHVLLPYADGITQVLAAGRLLGRGALPSGVETEALLMRGRFAYPPSDFRDAVYSRVLWTLLGRAPWHVIHHLDPVPFELVARAGGDLARRSHLMPDPVEPLPAIDRQTARRKLGLPVAGRYVGGCGLIDRRKGADLLIRAFAAASLRADDRLLLAGRFAPEVRQMVDTEYAQLVRSGRICALDRFLSDEELDAAVLALDVMCTPYPRHIGSASIVIRAAAAGRPVVACDFGWMGYIVNKFALGRTCNVHNAGELAAAIGTALEGSSAYRPSEAARRLVAYHTPDNFRAAWTARLRERLGLPRIAELRTWGWVVGRGQQ